MVDRDIRRLEPIRLEEYRHMHEHLRGFENSMTRLVIVSIVASASLLSAVGAFFIGVIVPRENGFSPAACYLFLTPVLLLVPMLGVLAAHRKELVRIALYLLVFYEEETPDPMWHKALRDLARFESGGSQDLNPSIFLGVAGVCCILFVGALNSLDSWSSIHLGAPLVVLGAVIAAGNAFSAAAAGEEVEDRWRVVHSCFASGASFTVSADPCGPTDDGDE